MTEKEAIKCLEEQIKIQPCGNVANAFEIAIKALKEYITIHETPFLPTEEAFFEEVEKALGFKLYVWQKTYISSIGHFRKTGETTAICLKELLNTDAPPIDFSIPPKNARDDCERHQFREIQEKLIAAGIPTRTVFWSKREKEKYAQQHRYELIADGKEIKMAVIDAFAAKQEPLFRL